MSYRAFWQRRCRAAAAGAVLKPQGGNCAVLPIILLLIFPKPHADVRLFFLPFRKYLLKYLTFFFIVLELCVFTIAYHPTMLHPSAVFLPPGAAAQKEVFPHDSYSD